MENMPKFTIHSIYTLLFKCFGSLRFFKCFWKKSLMLTNRAGRYIACDMLTSDAISLSLWQMNRLRYERDIASLVSDLRLCVLNATPFENRWWRLTANQGAGFTDEMRMHIAWDISPSPTYQGCIYLIKNAVETVKYSVANRDFWT